MLHRRFQEMQVPDSIIEQRAPIWRHTQIRAQEQKRATQTQKPDEVGTQYLCQGLSIRIGEQFQYGAVPLRCCQGFS